MTAKSTDLFGAQLARQRNRPKQPGTSDNLELQIGAASDCARNEPTTPSFPFQPLFMSPEKKGITGAIHFVYLHAAARGADNRSHALSIRFLTENATYDDHSKTLRIPAIDGNRLVVFPISRNAIIGRLWIGVCSPVRLVELHRPHKKSFHLLALHKYRMKRVEPNGTVLVTPHDVPVLGAPPEADVDDE